MLIQETDLINSSVFGFNAYYSKTIHSTFKINHNQSLYSPLFFVYRTGY